MKRDKTALVQALIISISILTASPPLLAGVIQDSGPDGLLVLEAEDYATNTPAGGTTWTFDTNYLGFSGTGAMDALPNAGRNVNIDISANPRLDYNVTFVKTGTHYIWVRGLGLSGSDDSVNIGLDGVLPATSDRLAGFVPVFRWMNLTMDAGSPASFEVTTAGDHVVNIWMREDGFIIDKIVVTSNPDYTLTNIINVADLGTEANGNTGFWNPVDTATSDLTARPGFDRIFFPPFGISGLLLGGAIPVTTYLPPWHFEIALERPTDVDTAIGLLLRDAGVQALFASLDGGTRNFFSFAGWDGTGKGAPPAPDFSGVPEAKMAGSRLEIYFGQVDDRHMRWGVRSKETEGFAFAPDVDLGFSASATPALWSGYFGLVSETREAWFLGFGAVAPPDGFTADLDYIRVFNTMTPSGPPIQVSTIQDSGPDGLVELEAEDYNSNVEAGGTAWTFVTNPPDFSGTGAMHALPDAGSTVDIDISASPRLDYNVTFVKTGTHYIWVRGLGGSGANSVNIGLDGVLPATSDRLSGFVPTDSGAWGWWRWANVTLDASARATFEVTTPGDHVVNIWMREDGLRIDKIVITSNPDYNLGFNLADLGTEANGNTGSWFPVDTATSDLTARPGFDRIFFPPFGISGLLLGGGISVTTYLPPWHFEIALERPTDVNTAIGLLLRDAGIQALFYSLDGGTRNFFSFAGWDGTGKGAPPAPDFSGVPEAKMAGSRLEIYFGQVDDRHVRWGVRSKESEAFAFAPDVDLGFSASAQPAFWNGYVGLVSETRETGFLGFGAVAPPDGFTADLDYIRVFNTMTPGGAVVEPPGPISIKLQGNDVIVSWPGSDTLQSADQITGPWVDATDQSNPQTVTRSTSSKFYRLKR